MVHRKELGLGPDHEWSGAERTVDARGGDFAREQDQQALRESERQLLRVVNDAPVGIAVMRGQSLEYVSVNPAYQAVVGPGVPIVGRTYREVFPQAADRGAEQRILEVMRTGARLRLHDFRTEIPGRGGPTWWEGDCLPLPEGGGEIDSVLLIMWEVTDRKRIEEALRKSEEQFRDLVSQVKDYAIFRIDIHGRALTWNEGVQRVLGYSEDEFVGHDLTSEIFMPEDFHAGVPERELDQAADEGAASNDRWLRRKGGEPFYALGITSAIRDESGRITGFRKVMRDHTRLRLTEESLRESEERLRLAAEATGFGTYDFDPRTGKAIWSDRLRAIVGVAGDGPVEPDPVLRRAIHPADQDGYFETIRRALQPDAPGPHEAEFRIRRDGELRWLRDAGHTMFEEQDGRRTPVRMVGTVLDISELKFNEEHLRFVMAELNHRVKNTLAVVEATADQTFRHVKDPGEFMASFSERLRSLSKAHQLLTRSEWAGAWIEDLVRSELASRVQHPEQLYVAGPPLLIKPDAAMALHMVIHELSTNAVKYGALRSTRGCVSVRWRLESDAGPARLVWEWLETGGPPCAPPQRRGFGAKVLERTISYQLEGDVDLEYRPEGLRCVLRIPWSDHVGVPAEPRPSPLD